MPVGEGPAGKEIPFYIIKGSFDSGLSVCVVNPMRHEFYAVDPDKGLHRRGETGIRAGAVTDNHTGIIDNAAMAGPLHIRHGFSQEGFTFKSGEFWVVLDKKLPTVCQGKCRALGRKQAVPQFEPMRRGVMLHLLAWLEMIPAGPFLCRVSQLILTDQPGQTLVGNLDIITSHEFLLNPDNVALTFPKEFPNLPYVLIISGLFADFRPGCRCLKHLVHRVAGDLQLFGDHPLFYALFCHFPDHLLFDGVDHIQDAP